MIREEVSNDRYVYTPLCDIPGCDWTGPRTFVRTLAWRVVDNHLDHTHNTAPTGLLGWLYS